MDAKTALAGSFGNQTSGYATNAAPSVPNFYDSVENAEGKVAGLVARLSGIADRLCGPVPADDANALKSVSNGLLQDVMSKAFTIQSLADAGQDALNRIERALP